MIEDFPLRTIKMSLEIEYLTTILFFCRHLADYALQYKKVINCLTSKLVFWTPTSR